MFIPGDEGQATVKVNSNTGEIEKLDYATMYLTFEAIESGAFKFSGITSAYTLSYSLDDGTTWTSLAHDTDTPTINADNKIMWKGNLTPQTSTGIGRFVATGKFDAYGNIMSLLYGDNFAGQISLEDKEFDFTYLFYNNTKIVNTQNLILPLASGHYYRMFEGCTSLITAPALPATTLGPMCYSSMFNCCTSLTTAPALPATTLSDSCYSNMFQGCTSLTTAPALPATTLTWYCYGEMFDGCTSLTTAPELSVTTMGVMSCVYMFQNCTNLNYIKMLATDVSASGALDAWVEGVSPTGTFVKAAGVTIPTGGSGIPDGWTVVEV